MYKENLPDTPAFQDDFTKEFLNAEAEDDTPEGFHLFESWTHKYSILYPEDYIMSDGSYYRKKSKTSDEPHTENVFMRQKGISPKENDMIKGIQLFLKPDGNHAIDATINAILNDINAPEETEINEIKDDNKTIYYVENVDEYHADDGSIDQIFYFYGLVADNHSKQAIYFSLRDKCFNVDTQTCTIDFESEKDVGLKMMKSVEFK